MLDEAAQIEDAKYYAQQEGIEKGIKQGIEGIAKKKMLKGNSDKEIMELTNLSLAEVQALRQDV
ncbi:hypothetical protein ACIQXI_06640 [Lysinibacillus sp. NPDC097195]|uniref:hypothetical protein n=1 Tax=Lysinibacillus sp. NPDC097195 TaxID=3364141 RepID=UPI003827BCAD